MMLAYENPMLQHTPAPLSPYLLPHHTTQLAHASCMQLEASLASQPQIPVLWPQNQTNHHLAVAAAQAQAHVAGVQAQAIHEANLAHSPEYFEQCLLVAHEMYDRGDYREAYNMLLSLNSTNLYHLPTLLLLGCTCYSLGLYDLSLQYNQYILSINPNFSEAYSNQGTVFRALTNREDHLQLAEQCYRQALSLRPVYWDAAINLAGLLSTQLRWLDALQVYEEYEKASNEPWAQIEIDSNLEDLNIISLLEGSQQSSTNSCVNSLEKRRDLYFSKGNLYYALNQPQKAKVCFFQSVLSVGFGLRVLLQTYKNCTVVPPPLASPQQAAELLQNSAALQKPLHNVNISSAMQSLAKIYQDAGDANLAVAMYYSSLSALPAANTCNNLGILLATHRLNESVEWYKFGLLLDSNHVHLFTNLGSALKDLGHLDEGIQCYRKAIELQPNFYIALANLANVYKDVGRVDEAIDLYHQALLYKPDFVEAFCNYTNSLLFVCNWNDRSANLVKIRELVVKQLKESSGSKVVPTVLPFHTFTYSSLDCDIIREISCRNAERVSYTVTTGSWFPGFPVRPKDATGELLVDREKLLRYPYPYPLPPDPSPKIKIGYVSSDFNNHPLAHLMQSVFGFHDRSKFEVICYSLSASDNSSFRAKIEQEADKFVDVHQWSLAHIVEQIALVDRVHILVNLNGYTKGGRNEIFAARPAPISMTFMGFAGTMGAFGSNLRKDYYDDMPKRWVDYFVVDETVCGRKFICGEDLGDGANDLTSGRMYTERLIYMPNSFFVNDHKQGFREMEDPELDQVLLALPSDRLHARSDSGISHQEEDSWRQTHCAWRMETLRRLKMRRQLFPQLSEDTVIFANFNQLYKLDPVTFKTWLTILQRVPNSVLWLLRFPKTGEENLRKQASMWFPESVTSRLIFTDVASKHEHIHRGRVADLFLDTPECNAHTTAADVLWTGTPIVTYPRYDFKMCSRVAASIVLATGSFSDQEEARKFSFTERMVPDLAPHVYSSPALLGHWMVVDSYKDYEDRAVYLASTMSWSWKPLAEHSLKKQGQEGFQNLTNRGPVYQPFYDSVKKEFQTVPSTETTHVYTPDVSDSLLMTLRKNIFLGRDKNPLFDTECWVRNLEKGMRLAFKRWQQEFSLVKQRNLVELNAVLKGEAPSEHAAKRLRFELETTANSFNL